MANKHNYSYKLHRNIFFGVMINNILGAAFSCLFSTWFKASIAGVIGISASIFVSFVAYNAYISFPKVYVSNIVKYSMLHIPDFIFQVLTIYFLLHRFDCGKFIAYIAAAVLGMPIAYLSIKKLLDNDNTYYELDFHDDLRPFIEWINEHPILTNICIFALISIFFSVSNWSLVIGENVMKWDIWDAEYYNQVLMTDALANQTIPMWNPLMQYGSPWYSVIGSPIWYPFTLALAYLGYRPITISISYVMHLAIGGFGMFLLVALDAKTNGKWTVSGLCASIAGGLLYGGCGIFLSNAEHIMIIISAAWIPYVFYYVRSFTIYKRVYYGGMAGLCAGFIFLGGYPEMFYNLFLFLFIYVFFLCYQKEQGIIVSFGSGIFHFGIVCVSAVLASAISLLPFLINKGLLIRGNGLGEIPFDAPLYTLLSTLFPAMTRIYTNVEVSMVNFYMGILTVLLIPMLVKSVNKYKKLYAGLAMMAFVLCYPTFFAHSLFYRFLPMYDAFRFPTTNRAFLALFMILLIVPALKNIMDASVETGLIRFSWIVFGVCCVGAILSGLIGNILQDASGWNPSKLVAFSSAASISAVIAGAYLLIFTGIFYKKIINFSPSICLVAAVCLELLLFTFAETPITIASYTPTAYSYNKNVQADILGRLGQNENRVRDVNFANHVRSLSGINSAPAVLNKMFDEDGYVSFQIRSTAEFKRTYVRNIIEQNPVIYFTNNVVSAGDIPYEEWVNACDTPPEQIYVEQNLQHSENFVQKLNAGVVNQEELALRREDGLISLTGNLNATGSRTGRVRVYLSDPQEDILPLELVFVENEASSYAYRGNFCINRTTEGTYVDIFFPDLSKGYERLDLVCSAPDVITMAQMVTTERMTKDSCVDVSYFGFNDIEMKVTAPNEGYVTLLQTKHDGWSAYVDGEKTEISLVDGCFMGIHLDSGEHTVIMKFRPIEFFIGIIISGMCVIILLVLKIRMLLTHKMYPQDRKSSIVKT